MQYGPPILNSSDEAEYYFQELRAQQVRARQLFNCYLGEDEDLLDEADDYYAYYDEAAR